MIVLALIAGAGVIAALLYPIVDGVAGRLAIFFGMYVVMAALILLAYRYDGIRGVPLGFDRRHPSQQIGAGVAVAALLVLLVVGVPALVGFDTRGIVGSGQNILAFAIVMAVTVGFVEEIVFRGYLLGRLRALVRSRVAAVVLSSLAFGLFHLTNGDIAQVVVTTCIGGVLATARIFWEPFSLTSAIIAHCLYDAGLAVIATALR